MFFGSVSLPSSFCANQRKYPKYKSQIESKSKNQWKNERKELLKRASSSDNLLTAAAHFISRPEAKKTSIKEGKKFDMPSGFCVDFFVGFLGLLICSLLACKLIFGIWNASNSVYFLLCQSAGEVFLCDVW